MIQPTSLPRREVAAHEQVVEARYSDKLEQLRHDLLYDGIFHVIALQTLPYFVQQIQDVVHAVSGLGVGVEQAVEQAASAVSSRKARKRLALDQRWNNHLRQFLLRFQHPCMVDVVLETVEIVLDDRDEALVI